MCFFFVLAVIKHSLSKKLCLKLFHQLTSVDRIIDTSNDMKESFEAGSSRDDTRVLEREHRVYALLAKGCTSSPIRSCIADAIIASSTDNFPAESILNTLDERDRIGGTPSYWSSTGHHKTSVPETLLYQLKGDLCVITELSVQPFQAYFQPGTPIYSSHYVRFRLGHLDNNEAETAGKFPVENKYVWTYTSQEFPMAQVGVSVLSIVSEHYTHSSSTVDNPNVCKLSRRIGCRTLSFQNRLFALVGIC